MKVLLATIFISMTSLAFGQLSLDRQVTNRTQKGKWKSAEEILEKAIRKDSLNPEARYVYSKLFFTKANPRFNIDSSYQYIQEATRDYALITPKEKERLKRFPLDSTLLLTQRKKIDSAAFEQAKQFNTEKSYQQFISTFTSASQITAAVELRNEVAFVDALKANTPEAFKDYLDKYPASARANESRSRYEKLLYENNTKEGTLEAYETFYSSYPTSPYHLEAARNIFEIATADGSLASFKGFIATYQDNPLVSRAESILYHLAKEEEDGMGSIHLTDSLKQIQRAEQGYWVPVLRNGKFGFIDDHGNETVAPQFETVKPEYLCGNIREDYVVVGEGILGRSGEWIVKSPVLEVTDLGSGFLKVNTGGCTRVIHKSGFSFPVECTDDVRLIGRNFVGVREQLKWGLFTLAGRRLLDAQYDDITGVDELVIFLRSGKKMIVTVEEVAAIASHRPLPTGRVFDDIQRLAKNNFLVRNGQLEGVLNDSLKFAVALNRQSIVKAPKGFLLKRGSEYYLSGISDGLSNKPFKNVLFYGDWIRIDEEKDLQLFRLADGKMVNDLLDSMWFENKLAFAIRADSLHVYLKSGSSLSFEFGTRVTFIKSADSTNYFFIPDKKKNMVFNSLTGRKMFSFEFDAIEYLGRGIFLCSEGGKKGLLSETGKVVLPIEYDAIIRVGEESLSLLQQKKFGFFSLRTRKLLKPVYERNVMPITSRWLVAYRDKAYGFIGWDAKPLGEFEFDEVRPWNDSAAMVRKNFQWMVYNIASQRPVVARIKDYHFITNTEGEKIVVVHQENQYGVVSSRRGTILPSNFTDIINVGSEEEPLYFVEKNVEEAGIYVVLYYDRNGKLLRKQVYEGDEYEKIYCAEK